MQQLSERVAGIGAATPRMQELLHLAQANDAYWHGLFGGIYLPHLRRAVWNALVELEALLDKAVSRDTAPIDLDFDGCDEFFLRNEQLQAVIRDDGLGAIHEFDCYRLRHNFGDTLARRPEHYYRKIRDHRPTEGEHHDGAGIVSAHDRVNFRHPISAADLDPDALPRALFIDRQNGRPVRYQRPSLQKASMALSADGIAKTMSLEGNRLSVEYETASPGQQQLQTEINLAMPSCDGFLGRYVVNAAVPGGFGQSYTWENMTSLTLEDGVLGGKLSIAIDRPVTIHAAPHKTVSQSEDGFEKIMQAVTLHIDHPPASPGLGIIVSVE
jgi:hypothetical protein